MNLGDHVYDTSVQANGIVEDLGGMITKVKF